MKKNKKKDSKVPSMEYHLAQTELAFAVVQAGEMEDVSILEKFVKKKEKSGTLNVNAADSEGCIALQFAVSTRNLDIVKLLVEHGSNVNHRDGLGFTALFWATGRYASVDIARYLIEIGNASVHVTTNTGAGQLHGAALLGNIECMELLIKHGANAKCKDHQGNTPLDLAKDEKTKAFLYKTITYQDLFIDMKGSTCLHCGAASDDGKELKRCGRCFVAKYCGRDCQSAHWKAEHRKSCPGSVNAEPCYPNCAFSTIISMQSLCLHSGVTADKQPESLRSKKFIVKVQVPITDFSRSGGADPAMMIYNEDRSVTGYITSKEKGFLSLFNLIQEEGEMGVKAFFWAELIPLPSAAAEAKGVAKNPLPPGSVRVFHGKCAQYQTW